MKNITLYILFLALISDLSYSQEYGAKLGVTISNISLTDVYPVEIPGVTPNYVRGYIINPSICVFSNIRINQSIDVQTNLSYIIIGSSETEDVTYRNEYDAMNAPLRHALYTSDIVLRYLRLGVDIKPKILIGKLIIYPDIGPSVSYLLMASNIFTKGDNKYIMFGGSIGGGIDLGLLTGIKILFDAKYCFDFTPFYETPYARLWNRYFSVSVGSTF